ncbi:MAG: gluconate 2-dehydrogenase subunit 3 family protein [Acidobacteriaceae bacterium]|nr:gluconate 2-dehydrogenase subunit 3 family protein [Acidobacteriaceae bacterium]
MTRRDAGWLILRAAAVAGGPEFFAAWLEAAQHAHASHSSVPPEPERWRSYQPKFFSAEEFHILDLFTAILIPADETPGAREAHVAPFIDFVVHAAAEYAPEMQQRWRNAIGWLKLQDFLRLTAPQQVALIEQMSQPEYDRAKTHPGFALYHLIKDMTVHAFYTSRVGLIDVLEYKGNAYLTEFPGCTHREHRLV